MQDHDPAANQRAVENASDTFRRLETKLEQSVSHGSSVRHTKVRAIHLHPLCIPHEACDETCWQRQNLRLYGRAIEGDSPGHLVSIAKALCPWVTQKTPNRPRSPDGDRRRSRLLAFRCVAMLGAPTRTPILREKLRQQLFAFPRQSSTGVPTMEPVLLSVSAGVRGWDAGWPVDMAASCSEVEIGSCRRFATC